MSETTVVELVPDEVTQLPRPLGSRIAAALLHLLIRTAITVAVIVVIVLLWWAIVKVFNLPATELPPPGSVLYAPRIRRLRQHAA